MEGMHYSKCKMLLLKFTIAVLYKQNMSENDKHSVFL